MKIGTVEGGVGGGGGGRESPMNTVKLLTLR